MDHSGYSLVSLIASFISAGIGDRVISTYSGRAELVIIGTFFGLDNLETKYFFICRC